MVIPNRWVALVYRIAAVILIADGIVRVTDLLTGTPAWSSFLYFTVQSNLLCLAWMIWCVVRTAQDLASDGVRGSSTPSARLGGAVMEAITVTLLVYNFVLVPTLYTQPGAGAPYSLTDSLVHVVTPALIIADWLLFTPKGRLRWTDPLLWVAIPYAYLAFAFTYSALGGTFSGKKYPYPFMDVDANGIGGVALWIAGLTVSLVVVGYLYVAIDRVLAVAATSRERVEAAA